MSLDETLSEDCGHYTDQPANMSRQEQPLCTLSLPYRPAPKRSGQRSPKADLIMNGSGKFSNKNDTIFFYPVQKGTISFKRGSEDLPIPRSVSQAFTLGGTAPFAGFVGK